MTMFVDFRRREEVMGDKLVSHIDQEIVDRRFDLKKRQVVCMSIRGSILPRLNFRCLEI